jgi:hypothetical protein
MGWVVSITPRPRFAPAERTPGTHWIGGWVGPRAGLDAGARGEILYTCRISNPGRPVRSQTRNWLRYPGSSLKIVFSRKIIYVNLRTLCQPQKLFGLEREEKMNMYCEMERMNTLRIVNSFRIQQQNSLAVKDKRKQQYIQNGRSKRGNLNPESPGYKTNMLHSFSCFSCVDYLTSSIN